MSETNGGEPITNEDLLAQNKVLQSWVIGLVTGCEGCTKQATKWVESMDDITTTEHSTDGD